MPHTIQEMPKSLLCFGGGKLDSNFSNPRVELEEASLWQRRGRKSCCGKRQGTLPWRAQGTLAMAVPSSVSRAARFASGDGCSSGVRGQ